MTELSGPDWDAVRRDYVAGVIDVEEIAARHGITKNQIDYYRAKACWPKRRPGANRPVGLDIIRRMIRLIDIQVAALEETMRKAGSMSATEIRTLETMTKTIDRLIAMDVTESGKRARQEQKPDPELEAIRERLVNRIQALETE
ncbi:hypothetical protein [Pelagibacterium xiamenense]|uniref:hypothetical protein n=1 Tax=Pelagibacterium xiamenense TaxID=2901140 RepID=UPI001E5CDB7D|nr:hypothetical protein [Pelagibacterium xiamenense]MCD7059480.1 hypothetical protein [Pelagibacterium xiamenense]